MIRPVYLLFTAGALMILFAASAGADIYKWTDAQGNVHFGDTPPADRPVTRIEDAPAAPAAPEAPAAKETGVGAEAPARTAPQAAASAREKAPLPRNASVEMYATAWCGYCAKARAYFRANGIQFTEYDIEKDKAANDRKVAMGARGVPTVVINGRVIVGFSPKQFEAALRGE